MFNDNTKRWGPYRDAETYVTETRTASGVGVAHFTTIALRRTTPAVLEAGEWTHLPKISG